MKHTIQEEELEQRFNKAFICDIPEHFNMSDHQFRHDIQGKLPKTILDFVKSELASQLQSILNQVKGLKRPTYRPEITHIPNESYNKAIKDVQSIIPNRMGTNE